jgi:hypothetical protein
MADGLGPCHRCGAPAFAEITSGYPDHVWRLWCRPCLVAYRQGLAIGDALARLWVASEAEDSDG